MAPARRLVSLSELPSPEEDRLNSRQFEPYQVLLFFVNCWERRRRAKFNDMVGFVYSLCRASNLTSLTQEIGLSQISRNQFNGDGVTRPAELSGVNKLPSWRCQRIFSWHHDVLSPSSLGTGVEATYYSVQSCLSVSSTGVGLKDGTSQRQTAPGEPAALR